MAEHQYTQQPKKTDNTSQKQTIPPKQIPSSHPVTIIQRARINPKSLTHADIMQLQRTIGNRAVGKLLTEIGSISSTTKKAQPVQMQAIPKEEVLQGEMGELLQRQEIREPEEEEPLQGKFESIQRQEIPEEKKPLQGKMADPLQLQEIPEEEEPLQTKRENNTGMPDNLKAGVESLSGIDMSDVRVHYNSEKPAEVGALAYTQGTDIHLAPGQERHLPHETWHVMQQAQKRVRPIFQMKDVLVNDDVGLEREADEMGEQVTQMKCSRCKKEDRLENNTIQSKNGNLQTIQLKAGDSCYCPGNKFNLYKDIAEFTDKVGTNLEFTSTQQNDIFNVNNKRGGSTPLQSPVTSNYISDTTNEELVRLLDVNSFIAEVDHIVPLNEGGCNSVKNAQVISSYENAQKSDKYPYGGYNGYSVFDPSTNEWYNNKAEAVKKGAKNVHKLL